MNKFESITKPLTWFMALVLAAAVAGCGGSSGDTWTPASSARAITAYSIGANAGTIDQTAKTIAVAVPTGTNVTALVATYTTTGASVKVGTMAQTNGVTFNNFTGPVVYTVTAADNTRGNYTVTVTPGAPVAAGPPAVNLLSILTNNFVILATTTITEAGPVNGAITGNIGSTGAGTAIAVTCAEMQGTSKIHPVDASYGGGTAPCAINTSTVVSQAVLDQGTAYTAASNPATPAGVGANLNFLGGNIPAGTTFAPGTYTWGSAVNINGDITLTGNASDVWIFQMSGDLVVAAAGSIPAGTHVILGGTAQASNVFWQVGGASATLGTYSTFAGNILTSPATLIAIQTGAVLHGRALSGTSVALDGNIVGP